MMQKNNWLYLLCLLALRGVWSFDDSSEIGSQSTRETVIILVPIHSTSERRQRRLCELILSLEGWPRGLMHVAMLSSTDSYDMVKSTTMGMLDGKFASVRVFEEKEETSEGDYSGNLRHSVSLQKERRARIARTRNYLWSVALSRRRPDWTLWLDSDLLSVPKTLLVDLRRSNVDLVVPACYCSGNDSCGDGIYDRNTYQESELSLNEKTMLREAGVLEEDDIVVRGYSEARFGHVVGLKYPPLFPDDLERLWKENPAEHPSLVPLDGIGATCILVKTDLYRRGLIFPPFSVSNAIESEGLAQIALKMGIQPYGRVDIRIRHA